jgi:cytochrome c-type biogenesis protein CcmH
MFLWIVMAVLCAAASLSVLVPLYRSGRAARAAGGEAVSIYKDQLGELDRDLARGLIGEPEAEAARTEIARRLIKASDAVAETRPMSEGARKAAMVVAIVVMPLAALILYLALGNPLMPDQPLAMRLDQPPEQQDVAELVARVEAHLATNPEDGRGWELLGPVYARLGRFDDAIRAFSNTVRLLGATAEREADLGEAITRANANVVTAEARAVFERAHALDREAIRPRFYLAVALDQEGRKDEAIAAWRDVMQGAPEGAPWAAAAREALARLEGTPPPGPTTEDVAAAGTMSAQDRTAMIEGMVASLAAKLEADPADAEGWARLIRSYMVLERPDDARSALVKARAAKAGDSEGLAMIETEARSLGLVE